MIIQPLTSCLDCKRKNGCICDCLKCSEELEETQQNYSRYGASVRTNGRFSHTLLFFFSEGYSVTLPFSKKVPCNKKECKQWRWRNLPGHSTRIGWARPHEGLSSYVVHPLYWITEYRHQGERWKEFKKIIAYDNLLFVYGCSTSRAVLASIGEFPRALLNRNTIIFLPHAGITKEMAGVCNQRHYMSAVESWLVHVVTNPTLRNRENFVLCFANTVSCFGKMVLTVLCFANMVLCLDNIVLCLESVVVFLEYFVVF